MKDCNNKAQGCTFRNDILISKTNKEIVPFSKLYDVLQETNMRVANQRRNETELFICIKVF